MTFPGYLNKNSKIALVSDFILTVQTSTLRLREFKGGSEDWAAGWPLGFWFLRLGLIGFVKKSFTPLS